MFGGRLEEVFCRLADLIFFLECLLRNFSRMLWGIFEDYWMWNFEELIRYFFILSNFEFLRNCLIFFKGYLETTRLTRNFWGIFRDCRMWNFLILSNFDFLRDFLRDIWRLQGLELGDHRKNLVVLDFLKGCLETTMCALCEGCLETTRPEIIKGPLKTITCEFFRKI